MPPRQPAEHRFVAGGHEVGEDEEDRAAAERGLELFEGGTEVGTDPDRLEGEQLADEPEHVAAPLGGREMMLDAIGEERRAHPVVVPCRGQGEHRGHLGAELALGTDQAAEPARGAEVHQEHHRELALLEVALDVGAPEPRGDVPVDGADVVARLILAHLGELHPAAPERARVLARHDVPDEVAGGDLDPPDLAGNLVRRHGTGTASKIRPSSASGPIPSASAR